MTRPEQILPRQGEGDREAVEGQRRSTVTFARQLRRAMSLPEVLLWQELRCRPHGHKFRRQHPYGPYVVDFFCLQASLAIEIDGGSHDGRVEADAVRDTYFAERGIRTLRIPAAAVLNDVESAVTTILAEVGAGPLHHAPHGPPPPLGEDQE